MTVPNEQLSRDLKLAKALQTDTQSLQLQSSNRIEGKSILEDQNIMSHFITINPYIIKCSLCDPRMLQAYEEALGERIDDIQSYPIPVRIIQLYKQPIILNIIKNHVQHTYARLIADTIIACIRKNNLCAAYAQQFSITDKRHVQSLSNFIENYIKLYIEATLAKNLYVANCDIQISIILNDLFTQAIAQNKFDIFRKNNFKTIVLPPAPENQLQDKHMVLAINDTVFFDPWQNKIFLNKPPYIEKHTPKGYRWDVQNHSVHQTFQMSETELPFKFLSDEQCTEILTTVRAICSHGILPRQLSHINTLVMDIMETIKTEIAQIRKVKAIEYAEQGTTKNTLYIWDAELTGTALHLACLNNEFSIDFISILLEKGWDPNEKVKDGDRTCLDLAVSAGRDDIIELFIHTSKIPVTVQTWREAQKNAAANTQCTESTKRLLERGLSTRLAETSSTQNFASTSKTSPAMKL